MTSTEAAFSFTTKIGSDLFTVRGDTANEFADNARTAVMSELADLCRAVQEAAGGSTAPVTTTYTQAPQAPAAPEPTAPAPIAAAGLEVETNKWGNKFTYNHPDAPDLPDGRGKYIQKDWTTKSGQRRQAWVDPTNGPRPAKPGASEAPIIWL